MKELFCTIVGVIGSALIYFFGDFDTVFIILGVFMLIDYISGVLVAVVFKNSPKTDSGKANSGASLKGIIKKVFMLSLVGVANLLDIVLGTDFIRGGLVIAFIANETISIVENAGLMGISIPKVLQDALDILNEREEKQL